MNLLNLINEARRGKVQGAVTGLSMLNLNTGGIYPGMYITVASEQKVGKSTFVAEYFIASLLELNPDIEFEFNVISTEMPRYAFESKLLSRKIYKDTRVILSTDYVLGRKLNPDGSRVKMSDDHYNLIERYYKDYIEPLSGQFEADGTLKHKGLINWIPKDTPTNIKNTLFKYAENNGMFTYTEIPTISNGVMTTTTTPTGYIQNNPNKITINILDHIRQIKKERGMNMKDNVDTMSAYFVELSNLCGFVNIAVVHLNRWVSLEKLKYMTTNIIPTADDIKDSGNLGEDSHIVITLMDPSDPAYKLTTHKGFNFSEFNAISQETKYRSAHLVENRYGGTADAKLGYIGSASNFYEIK